MDRNALLSATKTVFLRAFQDAIAHALASATTATFRKANFSNADAAQRLLLDAHRILQDRLPELTMQCQRHMEQLLNRGFQTAYSTFRPSFAVEFSSDTLSLVESAHLEDQLRIDSMTASFRNAADHQLQELNTRVALLFEQKMIKERENPFRPWLFTRCVADTVRIFSNRADLSAVLSQQIADALEPSVPLLYSRLNAFLAEHGIVARRQPAVHSQGLDPIFSGVNTAHASIGNRVDTTALQQVVSTDMARDFESKPRGAFRLIAPSADAPDRSAAFSAAQLGTALAAKPGVASDDRLGQLMMSLRQQAAPMDTVQRRAYGLSPDIVNPAAHRRALADVAPEQRDFSIPGRDAGHGNHGWLARPDGPAATLRRFFAGAPAFATYGTAAPDARIEPHMDSRVDRSISPLLARTLQDLIGRPERAIRVAGETQWQSNEILKHRDMLTRATEDVSEQMTIDVVAMLFEFILWDNQVPEDARAQLGRLQFLVLKLALRESTLLTQKSHPARVLLDQLGMVCVGLHHAALDGARVSREIARMVDTLLTGNTESSAQFPGASRALDAFIANDFRTTDFAIGRAVALLESARSHSLRFARVVAQLDEALSGLNIDGFLRRFLLVDWVHVIGHAEQTNDAADTTAGDSGQSEPSVGAMPGAVSNSMRYRLLVADLLWSIVPHADAESRPQLLKRLPGIVRTIREGLADVGWTAQQQKPILDWLVHAHRCVLHGNPDARPGPTLADLRQHFDLFIRNAPAGKSALCDTVPSAALEQMIVDEAIRTSGGSLTALDADEGSAADLSPDDTGAIARQADGTADPGARLCAGIAVEFRLNRAVRVATVKWIDLAASALILTTDGRETLALVGLRRFRRLFVTGHVRFVEATPLVERAMHAVIHSAAALDNT